MLSLYIFGENALLYGNSQLNLLTDQRLQVLIYPLIHRLFFGVLLGMILMSLKILNECVIYCGSTQLSHRAPAAISSHQHTSMAAFRIDTARWQEKWRQEPINPHEGLLHIWTIKTKNLQSYKGYRLKDGPVLSKICKAQIKWSRKILSLKWAAFSQSLDQHSLLIPGQLNTCMFNHFSGEGKTPSEEQHKQKPQYPSLICQVTFIPAVTPLTSTGLQEGLICLIVLIQRSDLVLHPRCCRITMPSATTSYQNGDSVTLRRVSLEPMREIQTHSHGSINSL